MKAKILSDQTPLFQAALSAVENIEMMELLLKYGSTLEDSDQNPILCAAAVMGRNNLVKYLVETKKARVESCSRRGYSPLAVAVTSGHYWTVKLLLEYGASLDSLLRIVGYVN